MYRKKNSSFLCYWRANWCDDPNVTWAVQQHIYVYICINIRVEMICNNNGKHRLWCWSKSLTKHKNINTSWNLLCILPMCSIVDTSYRISKRHITHNNNILIHLLFLSLLLLLPVSSLLSSLYSFLFFFPLSI